MSHAEQSPLEAVLKPVEEAAEAVADKVHRPNCRSYKDALTPSGQARTKQAHPVAHMTRFQAVMAIGNIPIQPCALRLQVADPVTR